MNAQINQAAVISRRVGADEEMLDLVQIAAHCDLTEAALKDFVRDRLAGYNRPARIVLTTGLPTAHPPARS